MELKKFVDFDELEVAFRAKTDEALKKRHFIFSTMQWPWLVKLGTSLTKFALATGLPVKKLIKSTIFDIFCGGETLDGCQRSSNELAAFGIGAIFDYSVEGEKSEEGFDQTTNVVLDECHERVFSSSAGVEQVRIGRPPLRPLPAA